MSLYDFMINASQSGQIADLYEKIEEQHKEIEELKLVVENLSKWVLYLKDNQCQTTPNNALSQQSIT